MIAATYAVVIPTIGRPGLASRSRPSTATLGRPPIVVADDRRDATSALDFAGDDSAAGHRPYPRTWPAAARKADGAC
jgi:hypothetical protein